MNGFVYYATCSDMPHLIKIGRTIDKHQRLREANSHDTFKPPSGYKFGMVLEVTDMCAVEKSLHAMFSSMRRLNVHGNKTEFFAVSEIDVIDAFIEIEGDIVDISSLNPIAESEENTRIREFLRNAISDKKPCEYQVENPKRFGSKSHLRYEIYKVATTLDQSLALGTFEDIVFDYNSKFFTIVPPVIPPVDQWL